MTNHPVYILKKAEGLKKYKQPQYSTQIKNHIASSFSSAPAFPSYNCYYNSTLPQDIYSRRARNSKWIIIFFEAAEQTTYGPDVAGLIFLNTCSVVAS